MSTRWHQDKTLVLQPGTLWTRTAEQTRRALRCGAQQPIPTTWEILEERGIRFMVRVVDSLARKRQLDTLATPRPAAARGPDHDPYLPYEEALFVADVSDTHLCLLNKFNVIEHHLLIVTRAFEDQEALLTAADFMALWACMAEADALGFYNGGATAGASQRHKHLQVVPLPFAPGEPRVPIEPVLARARLTHDPALGAALGHAPDLPFVHALARIDPAWRRSPLLLAERTLCCYQAMLQSVGVAVAAGSTLGAYNLLVTRDWLLVVARTHESHGPVSVNALGFAGSLFVRNAQELAFVKEHGPLSLLERVAAARA